MKYQGGDTGFLQFFKAENGYFKYFKHLYSSSSAKLPCYLILIFCYVREYGMNDGWTLGEIIVSKDKYYYLLKIWVKLRKEFWNVATAGLEKARKKGKHTCSQKLGQQQRGPAAPKAGQRELEVTQHMPCPHRWVQSHGADQGRQSWVLVTESIDGSRHGEWRIQGPSRGYHQKEKGMGPGKEVSWSWAAAYVQGLCRKAEVHLGYGARGRAGDRPS